ncbi:MAG TPA: hypothetical protein VIL86_01190 [Tepidisphaeraceae bacterium]|jgi:hypothetical protein
MKLNRFTALAAALLLAAPICPQAFADDKPDAKASEKAMEEAYVALAQARTKTELALRTARTYLDEANATARQSVQATDVAHAATGVALRKALETEARKPEEQKDPALVESLNQRNAQIEKDYQQLGAIDRPAVSAKLNEAQQTINILNDTFNNISNMERTWKDTKLDLPAIQGLYESITKRVTELREQAQKAVADLLQQQKTWEAAAEAANKTAGGKGA